MIKKPVVTKQLLKKIPLELKIKIVRQHFEKDVKMTLKFYKEKSGLEQIGLVAPYIPSIAGTIVLTEGLESLAKKSFNEEGFDMIILYMLKWQEDLDAIFKKHPGDDLVGHVDLDNAEVIRSSFALIQKTN